MLQAIDEQRAIGKLGENIVKRPMLEHLLSAFALGDVAIDDDQPIQVPVSVLNGTGCGFQNAPFSILVTHPIFESLPVPAGSRLGRGLQYTFAIRWMYLID